MSLEAIHQEGLDSRYDSQLAEMLKSHQNKLIRVQRHQRDVVDYSGWVKKSLRERFEEIGLLDLELTATIDQEYGSQATRLSRKVIRLQEVIALIKEEQALRKAGTVERKPIGTTYYIDFVNGHDVNNDGTTPTKSNGDGPWATLDKFCESARSAGDKAIVRRGMTQAASSLLAHTSDGTINNPIIVEADYDNTWGDFATCSQTATLTFGSKTVTFAGDISAEIAAGDWIYVSGENNREFAYEVASVSGGSNEVVTLYLPYKGAQIGADKTIIIMPDAPLWDGIAGASYHISFAGDWYWLYRGIAGKAHPSSTNGVMMLDDSKGIGVKDGIIRDCSSIYGVYLSINSNRILIHKTRLYNCKFGISSSKTNATIQGEISDTLVDGNNIADGYGINVCRGSFWKLQNMELKNHSLADVRFYDITDIHAYVGLAQSRNCILSSAIKVFQHEQVLGTDYLAEDYDGVKGDTRQLGGFSTAQGTPTIQSETTIVRAGGSNISIKVTPSTKLGTVWEYSRLKIFDLPIYATTDSKTYTVYFKSSGTGNWTADPTNTELWIELEAWGHASNVHRKITKSTGVCDFNGDDVNWLPLTVTVAPAQAGVAYLRCYYCKTKEAGSNIFYVDPVPVIS